MTGHHDPPRFPAPGQRTVLLLANWWYPEPDHPISGIFVRKHAEAAARHRRLAVLHLSDRGPHATARVEPAWAGDPLATVRVRFARPRSAPALLARLRYQLRYLRALRTGWAEAVARFGRPDLVHLTLIPPPAFALAHRRTLGDTPYLVSEHSSDYLPELFERCRRPLGRDRITRRLLRRAAAVITPSEALQRGMILRGFRAHYRLVRNVVDVDTFRPPESRPAAGPVRLLHVSGLDPIKNIDAILRVMSRLSEGRDEVTLTIIGEGPDRGRLEELARALGVLGGCVHFAGHHQVHEVAEAMRSADALVLFSEVENAPCVIAEAMACSLPVIAPDTGGVPELVHPWSGILVPPDNEEALEQALKAIIDRDRSFDHMAMRRFAVEHCSYDAVGAALDQIYAAVLREREG